MCNYAYVCVCTLLEKVCANPGEVFMYFVCIKTLVKKYANSVCIGYIYIFMLYIYSIYDNMQYIIIQYIILHNTLYIINYIYSENKFIYIYTIRYTGIHICVLSSFSSVQLYVNLWTVAH